MYGSLEIIVVKHFKSTIRHKTLWNANAFRRLVVLDDGCYDARQRKRRTIQGVAKFNFLIVSMAIAAFQAIGLIALEVRYRTNLQPTLLCSTPYFKVIANCRREAHVASAKAQNVVRQFQFLHQALYMVEHLVETLVRVLRLVYAYNLYLVELMQTVKSSHIFTV